jgi:hypothetical protein
MKHTPTYTCLRRYAHVIKDCQKASNEGNLFSELDAHFHVLSSTLSLLNLEGEQLRSISILLKVYITYITHIHPPMM